MRLIIHQLTSLCRSRKRFSFIIIISLFICITFILFNIDYNNQSIDSLSDTDPPLMFINRKKIMLDALKSKPATIIQK
jgi:hypothetical protein